MSGPTSARFCDVVVLRVVWTLTDRGGRTVPGADDVAEALGLRLQRAAA
jgi:magnesium chelatase family protein